MPFPVTLSAAALAARAKQKSYRIPEGARYCQICIKPTVGLMFSDPNGLIVCRACAGKNAPKNGVGDASTSTTETPSQTAEL